MRITVHAKTSTDFLESIYDSYKHLMLGVIYKHVNDPNICEDIFHEAFIRIIKHADLIQNLPKPKMEAYIILIARGVSIDYIRKHSKENTVAALDDTIFARCSQFQNNGFIPPALSKVDLTLMLCNLTPEEQFLLIGKYYLGLSVNDLVDIVGGSPTRIRNKIYRARKSVFHEWEKAGIKMEDFFDE